MRFGILMVLATAAHADTHCKPESLVLPTGSVKPVACHKPPASVQAAVKKHVLKDFVAKYDTGHGEVTFGCDGLGSLVKEIVIEDGSGHGGSLRLWRATLDTNGAYIVHGVQHQGGSMFTPNANDYSVSIGTVKVPDIDTVRAGVTAQVKEIDPPPASDGSFPGMTGTFGSGDFHLLIRLTDEDGHVVEKQYTGYTSNDSQDQYLGLQAALDALAPIMNLEPTIEKQVPAMERTLFDERFVAGASHFNDEFYWWVKESFVQMAADLGGNATIPGLVSQLTVTKPKDRSQRDTRANAVKALIKITGWDPKGKSAEANATSFIAACK
ncbi:MAG: hypothetical protein QM831_13170 [Kofleriaceae bacterium]